MKLYLLSNGDGKKAAPKAAVGAGFRSNSVLSALCVKLIYGGIRSVLAAAPRFFAYHDGSGHGGGESASLKYNRYQDEKDISPFPVCHTAVILNHDHPPDGAVKQTPQK